MKNLVFGVGGDTHGMENTRRAGMELDESEVEFNMGKLFLLGNNRVNHVLQCRMDEIHLGGALLLMLRLLATGCTFVHGTGAVDGTIHDDADFLPGLGMESVSKRGNINLDNAAIERGHIGSVRFGARSGSLIGEELDRRLHVA